MRNAFIALLFASFAAPAFAQDATTQEPIDEAAWQAEWSAADKDGDGKLSREEAKAANQNMTDAVFDEIDADGDGFLSPEEDKAMLQKSGSAKNN
ncbi:hypothetical protein KYK30_31355 [Shinella yambaruensis]|uniref:EF-hand domain-containing protein n=1 Tax=Shinella yambaruensis TaxID=415996 RepID=A0ABQ5ZTB0_9HYPH|nr:hypothetical protein [Shinella yambaruensis]MCJ8029981.1 hypothetical protein [Shinella yambaruensis]MCU7984221.1 hypothetical protein [Shinella yambaruensis]GLR55182.1 hypothetical protein GCM10007923_64040 [Shinella yambaruensis]